MKIIKVMVAGDFGTIHRGHLDHIRKAAQLGDWLFIVTHPDEGIQARKGYEPMPLYDRMSLLRGFLIDRDIKGEVVLACDTDGSVVKTLARLLPQIYAKGGDRTPDNMPKEELETCERLGIRIVYGVGEQLTQSRDLLGKTSLNNN